MMTEILRVVVGSPGKYLLRPNVNIRAAGTIRTLHRAAKTNFHFYRAHHVFTKGLACPLKIETQSAAIESHGRTIHIIGFTKARV